MHFPYFCSYFSMLWATLVLPLSPNSSPPPSTSPLLQVLKHLPVFIFTFGSKQPVFNAGAFFRPASPPQWYCASVASCSAQKTASLQFSRQRQLPFNFQVQLIKRKKKSLFILAKYTAFPVCHIFFTMEYIQWFLKYRGLVFCTTDLKQIQKNQIYFLSFMSQF